MPGTSAGLKKAWETRRAKYGPSGRAPQTLPKSSKKGSGAQSGNRSSTPQSAPKSSRNTNRAQRSVRALNGHELPYDRQLELLGQQREDVLKTIRAHDRRRSTGKRVQPGYEYIERIYQQQHDTAVKLLREIDDTIRRRQEQVLTQERKKHGRRYH